MTAAQMIRSARQRAGLSQSELASRARLPQSVVSAYERGHRDPGADNLARVLAAAGFELRVVPAPTLPDPERSARDLAVVLDLAGSLPYRPSPELAFPPFAERVGAA
jgi:transcriptional regulator with XRE-family HTH domain